MKKPKMSYWRIIDGTGFKPDYIDVPGNDLRSYGSSVVVHDQPERFALVPDTRPLPFIKYFGFLFLPFFAAITYAFIPGREKWIFVIGGPICGGFAFFLIYFLVSQDVNNGPYFEFHPQEGMVRLPRYRAEIKVDEIECLQWITGGTKHRGMDRATDLNLIIKTKDGEKRRYFVLGSPRRKLAIAISEKMRIPVMEISLGFGGKRDMDARTS